MPEAAKSADNIDDHEARSRALGQMLVTLFKHWNLSQTDQLELLGLSPTSRALLGRYARGQKALPDNRDARDRAGWLLAIHKALRLLYPHSESQRYGWVKQRNKAFDNLTPLEVMREDGLIGVMRVARYLDMQRGR